MVVERDGNKQVSEEQVKEITRHDKVAEAGTCLLTSPHFLGT